MKEMYETEHKDEKKEEEEKNGFWQWYLGGLLSIIRSIKMTNPMLQVIIGGIILIPGSIVVVTYLPVPLLIVTILGGITLTAHGCWLYK